jgi:hypothetical protein
VLLVVAEADAATPVGQALALLEQIEDGHVLRVNGGSHVMFGRGVACVDDLVADFIVRGDAPQEQVCDAPVIDPYVPVIPEGGTPEELFTAIDNDLAYLPELYNWDGLSYTEFGCNHGGTMSFTGTDFITEYRLEQCAFRPDLVVSGEGRWDYEHGRSRLTATLDGEDCTYTFRQDWSEAMGEVSSDCP